MATIVDGGSATFNYLLYGEPDQAFNSYMQEAQSGMQGILSSGAAAFRDRFTSAVGYVQDSDALRVARAAVRKIAHLWDIDVVSVRQTIGELQQAPVVMIPFIMACPEVRELYHKQGCDGYGELYTDNQPGVVGEEHVDYQRVMDGIFVEQADGTHVSTTYLDLEESLQLPFNNQVDVGITWDAVKRHLAAKKEDPTSRYNGTLG